MEFIKSTFNGIIMPLCKRSCIILIFLNLSIHYLIASNCNCNYVIKSSQTSVDGIKEKISPGDIVCIEAGVRDRLILTNFVGQPNKPIIIKNCGGKVIIGGPKVNNAILINKSKYFRLTGSGESSIKYGIHITQTAPGTQGIGAVGFCTNFEIDHIEIEKAGFAGIMAKTDPICSSNNAERPQFTMNNVSIHNNYIHDVGGEALYVGNSFFGGTTVYCGYKQYPHEVRGLRVYNNRLENAGYEAIQVGSAVADCEIYNNTIKNFGTKNVSTQNSGIQMGMGSTGKVYGNLIQKGTGMGITIQGIGNNLIYNNIILETKLEAINVNTRPTPLATDIVPNKFLGGVYIINNTIGNVNLAIKENINQAPGNVFYNNLIFNASSKWSQFRTDTDWDISNNIINPNVAEIKFENLNAGNYNLLAGSLAIDKGKNVSSYGIKFDFSNKARPINIYDVGAFEYATTTTNKPPVFNNNLTNQTLSSGSLFNYTIPSNSFTDPENNSLTYKVTMQDGTSLPSWLSFNSSTRKFSGTPQVIGNLSICITATDNGGLSTKGCFDLEIKNPIVANPEVPADMQSGIAYALYEGDWSKIPDFKTLSPKKIGITSKIDLSNQESLNYFGFSFNGFIKIATAGNYTFYINCDDGGQILINNSVVVDHDGLHAASERSGSIYLSAGFHSIQVDYFEKTGSQVLEVFYESSGIKKTPIPASILFYSKPQSTGLQYYYYEGFWSLLPDFYTLANKKKGIISNFNLDPRERDEGFAMVFSGNINIPANGNYTFYINSDDGSKLYINNKELINNDGAHPATEKYSSIYLDKGKHTIRVEYFERYGSEILDVLISGNGLNKAPIPNEWLSPLEIASNAARINNSLTVDTDFNNITVYPNPFTDKIYININNEKYKSGVTLSVFNHVGLRMYHKPLRIVNPDKIEVELPASLKSGIYFIHILTEEMDAKVFKILKQ